MSVRKIAVFLVALGLGSGALAQRAYADEGAVIGPNRLLAADRQALLSALQKERANRPDDFAELARIRADLTRIDAEKRGRLAPITPLLKALGPRALYPMLEALAVSAEARGDLPEEAWIAWRTGLIEATGMLRDRRAAPVFVAILESPETEFYVIRAAAEALGRLNTDWAAQKLITLASTRGPKQIAIYAGMGDCRREKVAAKLATALKARPEREAIPHLIRALGNVGSAWAWQTPSVAASGEESPTRAIAARALVDAFVSEKGAFQRLASDAIMVVDDPSTPALIAEAQQQASAELHQSLDALAARFAQNPTRKPRGVPSQRQTP